jgi:hypothetical protein
MRACARGRDRARRTGGRVAVELALADERPRIDGEPAALRAEHVRAVEVLVEHHSRSRVATHVAQELDRSGGEGTVAGRERRQPALEVGGEVGRGRGEGREGMARRRRPPQLAKDGGGDSRRGVVVGHRPQERPGLAALEQQRAGRAVVLEQAHRAAPRPVRERVGLVRGRRVRPGELEHGRRAVRAVGRQDERRVPGTEGRAEPQGPPCREVRRQRRQRLEPLGAARDLAPPEDPLGDPGHGTSSRATKKPLVRWTCGSVRRNSGRRGCRNCGHSPPSGSTGRPSASTTASFSSALIVQTA